MKFMFHKIPKLKLQSSGISYRLTEQYIIVILFFYPIYLFEDNIQGITLKNIAFVLLTFFAAIAYLYAFSVGQAKLRKFAGLLDCFVLAFTLINIILVILGTFQESAGQERCLFFIALAVLYFLISTGGEFHRYYFDTMLVSAALVFYLLILYYMGVDQLYQPFRFLLSDQQNLVPYLLLINTVSILLYCTAKEKIREFFYLLTALAGFFLLFICEEPISILINAVLFVMLPIIYTPTVRLIKRSMIIGFAYFFLLSNMPLFTTYWKLVRKELHYNIMYSIYLDLAMAIVGLAFFTYWDKLTKRQKSDGFILRPFRETACFLLQILLGMGGILALAGNKLDKMKQTFGIPALNHLVKNVQISCRSRNGVFLDTLQDYGFLWFLIVCLFVCCLIREFGKVREKSEQNTMTKCIALLFLVQSFFFGLQIVSTPLYLVFIIFGLFEKGKKLDMVYALERTEGSLK